MILTAKEIIYKHSQLCTSDVEKDMIEFAKMHVEEALKQASEKVELVKYKLLNGVKNATYVYKPSIIKAYPLENIK